MRLLLSHLSSVALALAIGFIVLLTLSRKLKGVAKLVCDILLVAVICAGLFGILFCGYYLVGIVLAPTKNPELLEKYDGLFILVVGMPVFGFIAYVWRRVSHFFTQKPKA